MPVDVVCRDRGKKFSGRRAKTIAREILKILKRDQVELSIALIDNAEMRKLNSKYRQKDYPTDVLSFPADEDLPHSRMLGDVVISVPKAQEQARERGRTLDEEMITLLIHGVVHLLGYDHERSAKDARIMTRVEKKIYRALCDHGIIEV
jgi:probable rRNA maturation factor